MPNLVRVMLTQEEAADLLSISPATLATWRCTGRYDLPFVRIGRAIRYLEADVLAFINKRRHEPAPDSL
jgi:hypothetical protein